MNPEKEILNKLRESIITYDFQATEIWANKAVEAQIDLVEVANSVTDIIREVGDTFARGEIFLPELVAAAKAAKQGMSILSEELLRTNRKWQAIGRVVIGTVKGDIHDIGKSIVASMLFAAGFEVIDLGVDITPEKFLDAIRESKPDILALSALLTTTAPEQKIIIEHLKKLGMRDRLKIIVGGGAITQHFAEKIEADGYGANASEAVIISKRLIETK